MRVVAKSETDKQILLAMENAGLDKRFDEACKLYARNLELSRHKKVEKYADKDEISATAMLTRIVMGFIFKQQDEYDKIMITN